MLFPEQVIVGLTIVRNGHVEGMAGVPAVRDRHLDIDRADVRAGDRRAGIQEGFFHVLAMIFLGPAPLHS